MALGRDTLLASFLSLAKDEVRACLQTDPDAQRFVGDALQQGLSAHPNVAVDASDFARFVGERAEPAPTASAVIGSLMVADLLLAFGCAQKQPTALRQLQGLLSAEVTRAARRVGASASTGDEALLALSASLLTGDPAPGITRYSGRGSLIGFVRVAAMRTLMRMRGADRRLVPTAEPELADTVADLPDPEVELIKSRYRTDFNDAFRLAMQTLSRRERAVLRLHLVGGLGIDAIGASYKVHRSTAARWIADARTKLLDETQRVLMGRLNLQPADARSLARLLRSQLDPGLTTILRESK